jgi:hypothetical protein
MSEPATDTETAKPVGHPEVRIPLSGLWAGFGCVQELDGGQMKILAAPPIQCGTCFSLLESYLILDRTTVEYRHRGKEYTGEDCQFSNTSFRRPVSEFIRNIAVPLESQDS